MSPLWTGVIGAVWIIGRIYYSVSYIRSADARSAGYGISLPAFAVLAIGAAIGVTQQLFKY